MELEDFLAFVDRSISELILYGELHSNKDYSDYQLEFSWSFYSANSVQGRQNIIYEIADKVYVAPDLIYPCVDLVIEQPSIDKTLRIIGFRARHEPRQFGLGWSKRPGPFIYGIGKGIKSKSVKTDTPEFRQKLVDMGLLHN
jgi:hypothetical protein